MPVTKKEEEAKWGPIDWTARCRDNQDVLQTAERVYRVGLVKGNRYGSVPESDGTIWQEIYFKAESPHYVSFEFEGTIWWDRSTWYWFTEGPVRVKRVVLFNSQWKVHGKRTIRSKPSFTSMDEAWDCAEKVVKAYWLADTAMDILTSQLEV